MAALGLLILVVAAVVGTITGLANSGSDHLVNNFEFFGNTIATSSGRLFLYGAFGGAAAMLGLWLIWGGTRRRVHHNAQTRRELKAERSRAGELKSEQKRLEHELKQERGRKSLDENDVDLTGTVDAEDEARTPTRTSRFYSRHN